MNRPGQIAVAAAIIAVLVIATLYIGRGRQEAGPPPLAAGQNQGSADIPSVTALMGDPAALKAAAKTCSDGNGSDVMTLCDRVHSAQAQLLAQKYRDGADAKGTTP